MSDSVSGAKISMQSDEYAKKHQNMCAFFTALITSQPLLMSTQQYMQLLAQIALMRFSPDILQFEIDGKSIKAHIGSAFVHFLGSKIYEIQKQALGRFLKELHSLAHAEQHDVVYLVLSYFSTISPLSDETGNDCPSDKTRKYHTMFLFGMPGTFFTAVCDFAVTAKILTIEQVRTFFKVSGQNGFMRDGKATSSSLTTHDVKVGDRIANLQKAIAKTGTELKNATEQLEVIKQKLADSSLASKHTGLVKNKDALKLQIERATSALSTLQANMNESQRLLASVREVESTLFCDGTLEVFYPGENKEDPFSQFIASSCPCISHVDQALKLNMGLNFRSLCLINKFQTKHHNAILLNANKEALRRMTEAGFQGDSSKSSNVTEGVVVSVVAKFADERSITCNIKVKNDGAL